MKLRNKENISGYYFKLNKGLKKIQSKLRLTKNRKLQSLSQQRRSHIDESKVEFITNK
jgi:hypothetical protein